jgi:tRNA A37 threonylcarbamoyladenosine biosynthesis protein TsaE
LYRLGDIEELYDLGFEPSGKHITVAEWYEGYEEFFEGDDIVYVKIERDGFEDKRKIEVVIK